ncbi:replication initiator [Micromonospora peucetia]|uniref:replication initiator n=1 Tax=Micromonospora peucetia TaxID=47871 RepID=UPI00338DAC0C
MNRRPAFTRATRPDYFGWLEHVQAAAGCTRPVRPSPANSSPSSRTPAGFSISGIPTPCPTPPSTPPAATVCPSCAHTYQRDAYQLLRAALVGGKDVPETVASHPAVFATFTAPSFGPVHVRVVRKRTCGNRKRCDCRRSDTDTSTG